ncbi:MAG: hypothetical protein HN341_15040 [Verrucomicrobia bacterium]|jgi:hypothetical protein|nr:hypothetical protein [Verrucomicrobiota bacterium]
MMRSSPISRMAFAALTASLAFAAAVATAQVPDKLNYQGVLRQGNGDPIGEGYRDIHFRIWDLASNGTLIWGRTQSVHTDADGTFSTVLNEGGAAISGAQTESLATVFTASGGEDRYLELTVGTSTAIMPRQRFVTAPYAFMAGNVDTAKDNFTVEGALTVHDGAQVKSLTVDDDAEIGGNLTVDQNVQVGSGGVGNVTVNGYNFFDVYGSEYDVWIQGRLGSVVGSDSRNLALLGNATTDRLFVNVASEYTAGTEIGGPVDIVGGAISTDSEATIGGDLTVNGHQLLLASASQDVWIQGGGSGSTSSSGERNLALLGHTEAGGDKLYVNYDSEYSAGTRIGGPVDIPSGTVTVGDDLDVGGDLDVNGYNFLHVDSSYDVWIQGGQPGDTAHGGARNLAILGETAGNGDKLYVNYESEYSGGTEIGGPVEITSWKTKSFGTDGYADLGGVYIQWGNVSSTSDSDQHFDFPIAFPTACYSVVCNRKESGSASPIGATSWSRTRFTINRDDDIDNSSAVSYIAIGR